MCERDIGRERESKIREAKMNIERECERERKIWREGGREREKE